MATSKQFPSGPGDAASPRWRLAAVPFWLRRAAVVAALAAAALVGWNWSALKAAAVTATSVGARVACACHYIGGRELKDCRRDFEPGMGLVSLWEDEANHAITARIPLVASQTARFAPGPGCVLESWR